MTGTPTVDLYVAVQDFDTDASGVVTVGVYECGSVVLAWNCTLLSNATASFDQSSFGADFGLVTVDLPAIDHSYASNDNLLLKVVVPGASDDDLWFAYATTTYPMRLQIR